MVAGMQLTSGLLFFIVSVRLEQLRSVQRSMASQMVVEDFEVLLGKPDRLWLLILALLGAALLLAGSVILAVWCAW